MGRSGSSRSGGGRSRSSSRSGGGRSSGRSRSSSRNSGRSHHSEKPEKSLSRSRSRNSTKREGRSRSITPTRTQTPPASAPIPPSNSGSWFMPAVTGYIVGSILSSRSGGGDKPVVNNTYHNYPDNTDDIDDNVVPESCSNVVEPPVLQSVDPVVTKSCFTLFDACQTAASNIQDNNTQTVELDSCKSAYEKCLRQLT